MKDMSADRIRFLIQETKQVSKDPETALNAMVALARIYREGAGNIQPDYSHALYFANQTVPFDDPAGILEYTRVIGALCTQGLDRRIKKNYVDTAMNVCNGSQSIKRCPEISYNLGALCEILADSFDDIKKREAYLDLANDYYFAAMSVAMDQSPQSMDTANKAGNALFKMIDGAQTLRDRLWSRKNRNYTEPALV